MIGSLLSPALLNAGLGWLAKLVSWTWQENTKNKHLRDLMVLQGFNPDAVARLQSGGDTADPSARLTRVVIAVGFAATYCAVIWYLVHNSQAVTADVMVPVDTPWLGRIFGVTRKAGQATLPVSLVTIVWDFKSIIEFLTGFYFTKMGK